MSKRKTEGGWVGQDRPQTTELVLPPATGDPWERIETRAREDMAHKGRLFWAVESMIREQAYAKPAAGERGEGPRCDLCACVGTFVWERSAKQIKRIERTKKLRASALPVSYRCSEHVPYFAPEL